MSKDAETTSSQEETTTTPEEETTTQIEETTSSEETTEETSEETSSEDTEQSEGEQLELNLESLTLPEGFEKNDELLSSFKGILEGDASPQERAQALIDLHTSALQEASERISEAQDQEFENGRSEWVKQSEALSNIGGDKLEETLGRISEVVDAYGPKVKDDEGNEVNEVRRLMDESGLGDHPVMVQFLSNVANQLGESIPVTGDAGGLQQSQAEKLYPTMAKKE